MGNARALTFLNNMSTSIYLILGSPHSGRREIIYDLIEGGIDPQKKVRVYTSAQESSCPYDEKLSRAENIERLQWNLTENAIQATNISPEVDYTFFITEGKSDPIEQIEKFQQWLTNQPASLARIISIVHCALAFEHDALRPWLEGCVHFSDCVLLNYRAGIPDNWVKNFKEHYEKQCYPCLFEYVKKGKVANPALILSPEPRRLSLAFDNITDADLEEDAVDPYFERLGNGSRKKPLPNIKEFIV